MNAIIRTSYNPRDAEDIVRGEAGRGNAVFYTWDIYKESSHTIVGIETYDNSLESTERLQDLIYALEGYEL